MEQSNTILKGIFWKLTVLGWCFPTLLTHLYVQSGNLWKDDVFFAIVFLLFNCVKLGRAGVLRKVMGKTVLAVSLPIRLLLACPTDPSEYQLNKESVGLPRSPWVHGSL